MAFNSLMHDRNIYKNRPNFAKIALDYPEFRKYALADAKGKVRVDFNNPDALRMLTKILLKKDFNLSVEIPKGFLIPTIPQRLNYILWVEDLLTVLPSVNKIPYGVDIGCGPCAIFSLLGAKKNGWKFVSTESSEESLQWAHNNINNNNLNALINVTKVSSDGTLNELLLSNEDVYDFCLCNPPFFDNIDEIRKKNTKTKGTIAAIAKQEEIFAEGGEVAFVKRIIDESFKFRDRIHLYTSMFGKKKSFVEIWKTLQNVEDISVTKSQFCQGNTIRWGIAWTFLKSVCFDKLEKPNPNPKKMKKPKPPLVYQVPKNIKGFDYNVHALFKVILKIFEELEITVKVVRAHEHYIESLVASDKNTWSHQRRKRREMSRNVDPTNPCPQMSLNSSSVTPDRDCKAVPSLLSAQNKSEENCIISMFNCDTNIKNEQTKCNLSEPQSDSLKKFCSDLDSVKLNESHSFLDSSKESDYKPVECFDSSKIHCKNVDSSNSPPKSNNSLITFQRSIESSKEKLISKVEKVEDSSNVFNLDINTKFKNEPKKRQLLEDQFQSHKKFCLDSDSIKLSETERDTVQANLISQSNEIMNLNVSENDDSKVTVSKKASKQSTKTKVDLDDNGSLIDFKYTAKSLLFCTLKMRRAKELVLIEMNCSPEASRETTHQIFQYLKNKFQECL